MIVRPINGTLLLATQPDHAELSGQLAAHWGNDNFSLPEPYTTMVVGTTVHDNGWQDWDNRPSLNQEKRTIWDFITLPTIEHVSLYRQGIHRALEAGPYTGLMVCMHGTGLYKQRYGTDPVLVRHFFTEDDKQLAKSFVEEQELEQKRLRNIISKDSEYRRYSTDTHIWANYKLLQIFDRLSVYLCLKGATDVTLSPTPTKYGMEDVSITMKKVKDNTVSLTPYPFSKSPLKVSTRGRLVPNISYESDEHFREIYYKAERVDLNFEICSS
ncbi:MAG: DUF3891 family protein [Candidatus Bathyarchaeia archaeon]